MTYAWPLPDPNPVLQEALDIALDYLEATGQAKIGDDTQHVVASAVLTAWLQGTRHRIQLANVGIVGVQRATGRTQKQKRGDVILGALGDLAGFGPPQ